MGTCVDMTGNLCRSLLVIMNVVVAAGGAALAGVGVWTYLQLAEVVALRNDNHYLLDYEVHWPQVAPWMFICAGLAVLPVAMCGLCGALGRTRTALSLHALMLLLLVLTHAGVAILVFLCVDGEPTEKFIKDSVYDGIHNAKTNSDVMKAFGRLERRLRCCGADAVTDYRKWPKPLDGLPLSCCSRDTTVAACTITDPEANARLGCAHIAPFMARRINVFLGGGAAAVGALELVGLVSALVVLACRRSRLPRDPPTEKTHIDGFK